METTLEKSSAAANAEAKADSPAMYGSEVPTPRFQKAYLECLDDTGAITRLEPLYDFAQKMERENRALREGCALIAASIGNGSACSPDCSVGFLTNALANEVKLYCTDLRQQMVGLRREIQHQKNRADAHAGLPNVPVSESARQPKS
jgi:hypothetical protein